MASKAYENQKDLDKILRSHRRWCAGRYGGKRADFESCYFEGVTLHNVDLSKVNMSGAFLYDVSMHKVNLPVGSWRFDNTRVVCPGTVALCSF